jgi:hypothetical protein
MKDEEIFTIETDQDYVVIVEYNDESEKEFEKYFWRSLRGGIKKNLYNKGLIKSLCIKFKK